MSNKSVWVLTSEYNDYNQYGEYFEAVFMLKPTLTQLLDLGLPEDYAQSCLDTGGKRLRPTAGTDQWWQLKEVDLK